MSRTAERQNLITHETGSGSATGSGRISDERTAIGPDGAGAHTIISAEPIGSVPGLAGRPSVTR
jgi:hypothetical protein